MKMTIKAVVLVLVIAAAAIAIRISTHLKPSLSVMESNHGLGFGTGLRTQALTSTSALLRGQDILRTTHLVADGKTSSISSGIFIQGVEPKIWVAYSKGVPVTSSMLATINNSTNSKTYYAPKKWITGWKIELLDPSGVVVRPRPDEAPSVWDALPEQIPVSEWRQQLVSRLVEAHTEICFFSSDMLSLEHFILQHYSNLAKGQYSLKATQAIYKPDPTTLPMEFPTAQRNVSVVNSRARLKRDILPAVSIPVTVD